MNAQIKGQFYKNGPDNQRRADVTIDLRRIPALGIASWTPEQKKYLREFMETYEQKFKLFKKEILKHAK